MEKERESKYSEEEDEEIAEKVNDSLERRKKDGSIGSVIGEIHSVFFEAEEGVWKCRLCTWTYILSGPGKDLIQNPKSSFLVAMDSHTLNKLGTHIHTAVKGTNLSNDKDFPSLGENNGNFVSENSIQNGNVTIEVNGLNTHNIVDAEKDNHELGNLLSNPHFGSNGNGSTGNGDEIQECIDPKPEEQTKLIAEEYDLDKIIEGQETHDLYCPNCHSCITKRVILRKRKRTGRENKNDLPPEKLPHVPEVTPPSVEAVDQEDKTVFRCLSCFSFFIPTEGSFNIFRLFGTKDGSSNLQNPENIPTQNDNRVPLLSGLNSTKNNDSKAGVPLLAEENNAISSRGPSSHMKDNSSLMPTVGAKNLGAKENKKGFNNTDFVMGDSSPSGGQMVNHTPENGASYPTASLLPDRSTGESYSNGVSTSNLGRQDKPTYASTAPREGSFNIFRLFGKKDGYSNLQIPEKMPTENENRLPLLSGSSSTKKNDKAELATGDSYQSGGQMGNLAQGNEASNSVTTMLPECSAGESFSNGALINNLAQQDKPTYASVVLKAEKPSSNGALMEYTEQEDKHSFLGVTVQNDISTGISDSTGGFKGTEIQGDKTSYPVHIILEDPSTGALYTNGVLIGTPDGNSSNLPSTTSEGIYTSNTNLNGSVLEVKGHISSGNDVTKYVSIMQSAMPINATTESNQINYGSDASNAADTLIDMGVHGTVSSRRVYEWDILKSIVYGGLIESIMSLTLVASAAGAGSSTIHICALGLANLVGGLFLLAHDLSELRTRHDTETTNQMGQQTSPYRERLGKREHAKRHTFIAVLSFIIFGALPPIIYAFTFRRSDHKEHKIIAMATASLFCVALLAVGKAHVKPQKGYLKSVFYYLGIALPASGLSYVAGVMIHRLFVELGLFESTASSPLQPLLSRY